MIPPDHSQRWREGHSCFRPNREIVTTRDLDVVELEEELEARTFVEVHHYSRRFPAARFRFGLYRRGVLVGVAVFSRPFTPEVITNVFPTLEIDEGVELGRFVLLEEVGYNAESWFLARCFRLLRGRVAGVVSFSDPCPRTRDDGSILFAGHVGTIYQSTSFNGYQARYLDTTERRTVRVLPDGSLFSNFSSGKIRRGLRGWRGAVAELERYGAAPLAEDAPKRDRIEWLEYWRDALTRPMRHTGNHRYAFALDRRALIAHGPDRPYPKRKAAA